MLCFWSNYSKMKKKQKMGTLNFSVSKLWKWAIWAYGISTLWCSGRKHGRLRTEASHWSLQCNLVQWWFLEGAVFYVTAISHYCFVTMLCSFVQFDYCICCSFCLEYLLPTSLLLLLISLWVMSDSFVTPWTAARQDPLSMKFPKQEYWCGLPFPSPVDLRRISEKEGLNLHLLLWQVDSLPLSHQGSPPTS